MTPRLSLVARIASRPRPVHTEVTSRLAEIRRLRGEVEAVAHAVRALRRDLDATVNRAASADAAAGPTEPSR